MRRPFLFVAAAALAASACGPDRHPAAPVVERAAAPAAAAVGANLDLSGAWDWSERTVIHLRPAAVPLFGIDQEGPITTLHCESWGELTIVDGGDTFAGSATQDSWCTTPGGQSFDPAPFPPSLSLVGEVRGRSLGFTAETGVFPCHYRGAVGMVDGSVGTMTATGHCEVPRELGQDRILGWTATRK